MNIHIDSAHAIGSRAAFGAICGGMHAAEAHPPGLLGNGRMLEVLLALTTTAGVAIVSNIKTVLLLDERRDFGADRFVELVVWQVPQPVRGSAHRFKYRLAFVVGGACVLRYDNEAGKGDHRHLGAVESPYRFTTPEQLYADFMTDVTNWRA